MLNKLQVKKQDDWEIEHGTVWEVGENEAYWLNIPESPGTKPFLGKQTTGYNTHPTPTPIPCLPALF